MPSQPCRPARHCQGAYAIMFVPTLIIMIALFGLVLDTGMLYNRKVELSGMVRAAALAAAVKLDGTRAGITAAQAAARVAAERYTHDHGKRIAWNDAALELSTGPARGGAWVAAGSVADPAAVYFAKVDSAGLGAAAGQVRTVFMAMFSPRLSSLFISDSAVAGRTAIRAVPLAVCAMSEQAGAARSSSAGAELVEYGFRRGVSYDLMQLNPRGTSAARYMVNPVVPPGMNGGDQLNPAILGPFVCSGTMWMPRLTGGALRVSALPAAKPLEALHQQLNTRFADYGNNQCSVNGAPPDINIFRYNYTDGKSAPWMRPLTGLASALGTTERGRLETVADIPAPGSSKTGLNGGSFGPLWSYAKAVKHASWQEGAAEPAGGYTAFTAAEWGALYRSDIGNASYPEPNTPYAPLGTSNPPTVAMPMAYLDYAAQDRRVLYLPLLACDAALPGNANAQALVAGVGKFFMTVPATPEHLVAEFAGATQNIPAIVELFP